MSQAETSSKSDPPEAGNQTGGEPVMTEVRRLDKESAIAVIGHPLHAMMVHFPIAFVVATLGADLFFWWSGDPFWERAGLWTAGFAFLTGAAAAGVGTLELVLVPGIRARVTSWSHAVAAMTLLAVAGTNWGVRLSEAAAVLPLGLALSAVATVLTAFAGYQGGKLIFDHGVGIVLSPND
ncbi:DUF2231 domain-containing protein [Fodinicurvata sp. EGI_FJ10296]|uniref:DUF2231 domain-containing protein n=1 Tax=Fodinicurvata sp. EGI_FJ10296 TaxID=3231908 RepID=UPI003456A83B